MFYILSLVGNSLTYQSDLVWIGSVVNSSGTSCSAECLPSKLAFLLAGGLNRHNEEQFSKVS